MKSSTQTSEDAPRVKPIAVNRKARHLYTILDRYEAGIVLKGTEVKAIRAGNVTVVDAYASFQGNELFLLGLHISAYEKASVWNHVPRAPRKLLLRRQELKRLKAKLTAKGLTLVPLRLYFKGSLVKVELGLAQGKKTYDKRETIKARDQEREMQREIRRGSR